MTPWQTIFPSDSLTITDTGELNFVDQTNDFSLMLAKATVVPLNTLGVIAVDGVDADKLLQGQLSCNINTLAVGDSTSGALCDIKGRMVAIFRAVRVSPTLVLLVMHCQLVAGCLAVLKKYAVFYKVSLNDVSADYGVLAVNGWADWQKMPVTSLSTSLNIYVTENCQWLMASAEDCQSLWQQASKHCQPMGTDFWQYLAIANGLGELRGTTRETFIPQMLNLQHTGAIDFRKGCYTGQEIVARMQYLGKLKKRMYRLQSHTKLLPQAGDSLDSANKKKVGTVVLSQKSGVDTIEFLAVLSADAAASDQLFWQEKPMNINVLPLPYDDKFVEKED